MLLRILLITLVSYAIHRRLSPLSQDINSFVHQLGEIVAGEMSFHGAARKIEKVVRAIEQSEGAGARVRRSIGTASLRNFSPFLMLDHFSVPKGAGFPDHPHRGQETVTYMLQGTFQHEDFAGHAGQIEAGDLQWMTAGIQHAEMPLQESDTIPTGLQLWVDLPARDKLCEPRYQELKDARIPRVRPNDLVEVKVISGESYGTSSPIQTLVGVWYMDVIVKPGGALRQPIPSGWNAFLYTIRGDIYIDNRTVGAYNTVVLESTGEGLEVMNRSDEPARFVLIAGEPLDQEVVQYGPFVMDSQQGIQQAFADYQMKTNGFERARTWRSKIGEHMM